MKVRYWVEPGDESGLLDAMMRALAGDAHISFEGDLSGCEFPASLKPSEDETQALRRQTLAPRMDFVVLPLEPEAVATILGIITPERRCLDEIIHIQIERGGELQFGSYDNFDPECVVCYEGVGSTLLDQLKSSGAIRSWEVAPADQTRWHD